MQYTEVKSAKLEGPCPGQKKFEGSGWEGQNSALRVVEPHKKKKKKKKKKKYCHVVETEVENNVFLANRYKHVQRYGYFYIMCIDQPRRLVVRVSDY